MKECTIYKVSVFDKTCKRISIITLVILLISLYPRYVNAQENIIKELELSICSSLPLINLNKSMGIAFSATTGKWYSESGEAVSNIFVFPSPRTSYEYRFYFLVHNEKVSCLLNNNDRFNLVIKLEDVPIPTGEKEQFLCYLPNETPSLNNLHVLGDRIKWYEEAHGGSLLPLDTKLVDGETYYASQVFSGFGESLERLAVTVGVGIIPELVIQQPMEANLTYDLNELVVDDLNGSGGVISYYSIEPESLEDMSGLITNYMLAETQDVYVLMSTPIGCYDINKVQISIKQGLNVPNGFSPNGDGVNDYFVIPDLENYPDNELIVFNRQEKIIYQSKNYQNNWDGKAKKGLVLNQGVLPEGTYFYVLKLSNDSPVVKGFIYLKH